MARLKTVSPMLKGKGLNSCIRCGQKMEIGKHYYVTCKGRRYCVPCFEKQFH